MLFWPRTIEFSYAGESCAPHISILPELHKSSDDATYVLEPAETVSIGGYPVIGRSVCVTAVDAPEPGTSQLSFAFLGAVFGRVFTVEAVEPPMLRTAALEAPVPATKPLVLELSADDRVFTYRLLKDEQAAECEPVGRAVSCDLPRLGLEQGSSHSLAVERRFGEKSPEIITEKTVKVLPAVRVEVASVEAGQTVYERPKEFTFTTDKELTSAEVRLVRLIDEKEQSQSVSVSVDGRIVTIVPKEDLARDTEYRLVLEDVEAVDGSALADPHELSFRLSGGPKVSGVNINTSGVEPGMTVVMQLDQPLKADQDVAQFVSVEGGSTQATFQGDRIYVPLAGLSTCQEFSVNVAQGLISTHDVESSQPWQFKSRTRCHTVSTIGHSVHGRPINAYYFGSGSQTVLFTGAIHGNELSSKYIMDAWISELEANIGSIPGDKRIVVIPAVSPDSVAAASRYNARNVNLNRNFPTRNWTSNIEMSGGRIEEGAGGTSALSEPEAAALARFTQQLNPRFVVTYHSLGSLVNGNDVGVANSLGPLYARTAGYRYIPNAATTATFGFEMTGTYEDWLAERGTAAILIELNTNTGHHFAQNKAAMWAMVRG